MKSFRQLFWYVYVAAGLILVAYAFIEHTFGIGVASAIVFGLGCAGAEIALSWFFGLRRVLYKHIGTQFEPLTLLERKTGASQVADVYRALEQLYGDSAGGRRFGLTGPFETLDEANVDSGAIKWNTYELGDGEFETFPTNAVYFLVWNGMPYAASMYDYEGPLYCPGHSESGVVTGQGGGRLRVLARSKQDATKILNGILKLAGEKSIYRGQLLHVTREGQDGQQNIRISSRPSVKKVDVVLPEDVLTVLNRTVSARLQHQGLLQRHGHSAKTGIMLHGPPGTGKTLICKHLIGECEDFSAIVPTGTETETIREAFRLAIYLQPSMIIFEDVDLLTEQRTTSSNVSGLQELMNEMDGLVDSTEAIILMTTNRPEVIEPALASRPGRVSQAIHFPLPNHNLRLRLLQLYTALADVGDLSIKTWVERTAGASPAFIRELVSRAIIFAAERDEASTEKVRLTDADFDAAIHELIVFGGTLTSNVLGFPETQQMEDEQLHD